MSASKILIVVNDPKFFLSHRLPIAIAAVRAGYEVHVAAPPGIAHQRISENGLHSHLLYLSRGSINPFREIKTFLSLSAIFRTVKPSLVHLVTIKPVLYGGILSRLHRVRGVLVAVSGLGTAFTSSNIKSRFVKGIASVLYRLALGHRNLKIIFQNNDDASVVRNLVPLAESQIFFTRGSGVDLEKYVVLPEPIGVPRVLLPARMLREKGIEEFVAAVTELKNENVECECILAGDVDRMNPSGISAERLQQWSNAGAVKWIGFQEDVGRLMASCHIVVLPSYREGTPKVLLEAAACGRAVVTTDVPGCRDAVTKDVTGILVPSRKVESLKLAIYKLLQDSALRQKMGAAGRVLAEREFSVSAVIDIHMECYRLLLDSKEA